ncbi:MAG: polysaccharide biosynthesis tyrosine autokinase [Bacteroidetes bacterium]|nr:polysaccharide biosynthesis tyrosine autokinase [Bacteroidota bacterium]
MNTIDNTKIPKSSGTNSYPGYQYNPVNLNYDEVIDFKRYFSLFISNWYWFAGALFIALSIAYGINRWSEDVFTVSAILLIEDEQYGSNLSGVEQFIPGGGIFKGQQNLKNEMGILKSFSLNYKVMEQLPEFWVTYTGVGRRGIAESRQYKNTPFKVIFNSLEEQIKGQKIDIKILSDNKYKIKVGEVIEKEMNFGEQFITDSYDFKIIKQGNYKFDENESNKFYFWFNSLENLTNDYRRKLNVVPIEEEASLVSLTTSGFNAGQETEYLNKLMDVYIEMGLELKNETADNTIEFINEQLGFISDSLRLVENNLENFRLKYELLDLGTEATLLQSRLERYENEKYIIDFEKRYYEYLLDYIESKNESAEIISPSLVGINNQNLSRLVNDLVELQQQKKQISFNLKDDLPAVGLIDNQISDARITLKENVLNSLRNTTKLLDDAKIRIEEVEKGIQKLPGTERQLLNIQRKFDLNNTVYNYLMEKRAEAGIAKASNIADNRIIDSAESFNSSRIKPKERHNYLIAFILGLFIPTGLLIFFDLLNNKIIDRRDIEKATDIPILGFIGHSDLKSDIPVIDKPGSTIAESFRSIRTRLKFFSNNDTSKVIAITSTVSGEGKTFISVNTASIIAMLGKKVLLIGLDLRKPKLHKLLGISNNIGLTSYLIGETGYEGIVFNTKIANLFFTPSGKIPPNPAELIESERMVDFFKRARKQYDYIIVDTPPVAIVTDTLLLTPYVDINLFVVRQRYSSKNTIDLINDLEEQGGLKNIGILINDISISGYYGYGLRYGNTMGYRGYYGYDLYGEYGYRTYNYGGEDKDYYTDDHI